MRGIPVPATLVVVLAVATMIGLGVWQLQRAEWKGRLLDRYEAASALPPIGWAEAVAGGESVYFRRAEAKCTPPVAWRSTSGRNLKGEAGWSHVATCAEGVVADLGWSRSSDDPDWSGGRIAGIVAADGASVRLVAANPAPGLEASEPPSPDTIPNNHQLYALQWFFFAGAAALIFALALRRRSAAEVAAARRIP